MSENLFIVFHTYGSHFNYKERYPEEFAKFQPANATEVEYKNKDQLINAYDNSVLYTDYFLHSLIGILKNSGADATMIYSPDHGEDLLDDSRIPARLTDPDLLPDTHSIPDVVLG